MKNYENKKNIQELPEVMLGELTGDKVKVDMNKAELINFDNQKKEAIYNVPDARFDDGSSYHDVLVKNKTIDTIKEKLKMINNPVIMQYNFAINFSPKTNDPSGKLKQKYLDEAKKHPEKYFTKTGNYRVNMPKLTLEIGRRLNKHN